MRVLLSGMYGHMGREVINLAQTGYKGAEVAAGVDINCDYSLGYPCSKSFDGASGDFDVIIDFSNHAVTKALCDYAVEKKLPLVIASTGQTDDERAMIKAAAKEIPVFFAANYSLGVALLIELAKKAAAVMGDAEIEIIETHHDRKLDAPSGTALAIAEAVKEVRGGNIVCGRSGMKAREKDDIGVSSVRIGNITGIHEVLIGTQNQTITLKHEAHSRALFAEGALTAAQFLINMPAGLYDMKSMVKF